MVKKPKHDLYSNKVLKQILSFPFLRVSLHLIRSFIHQQASSCNQIYILVLYLLLALL